MGGGDLQGVVHLALGGLGGPHQCLHTDEVDDADEVTFGADRDLKDQWDGVEPSHDHVDAAVELRPDAVKLVDEADPGDAVAVGLPPHGLGLGLDPCDTVEHSHGAVQDPQRPLHLHGEVDVAGGVDDVDGVAVPHAGRRGRGDGDATLLLLRHPVHRRGAFVHLADLVVDAGVEQDPLGRRGLARVDMGHDPDVADQAQGGGGVDGHGSVFSRDLGGVRTGAGGTGASGLPAVVGEGLVGLGHLVHVLAALHARAEAVGGVEDLVHQPLGHRLLAP